MVKIFEEGKIYKYKANQWWEIKLPLSNAIVDEVDGLLPCPFCGCKVKLTSLGNDKENWAIICDECKCAVCPNCGGDGEETCHNPDHGFIHGMMGWHEIGRLGCTGCGHDPNGKVKNGDKCETCNGVGRVTVEKAKEFIEAMGYKKVKEKKK